MGTMKVRLAAEYPTEESKPKLGEYAPEYPKQVSPGW